MSGEINALLGKTFIGGGYKKKNDKRRRARGGAETTYFACTKIDLPDGSKPSMQDSKPMMAVMQQPQQGNIAGQIAAQGVQQLPAMATGAAGYIMGGAKMSSKMLAYKHYLENMNADRLQKIASAKGLKITKKKAGKTVYVKKGTLVRKLCERKMGKMPKGSKGSKSKKGSKKSKSTGVKMAAVPKPASRKFMKRFSIF
jgi:hypothetical protein